ncbi:MAG: permease [Sphingomonas bacterium]|uniref:DMT family transporter n=1 Tax=Sphingomonas bacterium TaxID=1895847 RepID=UPI002625045D|nr:DMT family transporter [Sphingomonas bacterium]MDB5694485.1 permease [Sphingomonas bacterium]
MRPTLVPFAVACLAIAIFCVMDALMKELGLALGAYSALLWRTAAGIVITGSLWATTRPAWPEPRLLRLHVGRGVLVAAMASLWFHAITLVPLAEAIAISFFAPLLATWLASLFLGEAVTAGAVAGSGLGLAGVGVIVAGRLGAPHGAEVEGRIVEGIVAVIVSAVLYAINLVMQRHQAQQARPQEIAFFQTGTVLLCLLPFAPWAAVAPAGGQWPLLVAAALFASVSLLLLSWAYARAEAQVLVTTEYTGFVWLALLGWWFFGEELTLTTLAGATLIVVGCLLALRQKPAAAPAAVML